MWKIYKITTLNDNRVYIGCTSQQIRKRFWQHKSDKLPFALTENKIEILFETDCQITAYKIENDMILKLQTMDPAIGYNIKPGNNYYGHSSSTKEKMRLKALARDPSTFDKNRIKTTGQLEKLQQGRINSVLKNGHPMTGKKHSEETKEKIRQARLKTLKKLTSS